MLFPQLGPQYYDESNRSILKYMETKYAEALTVNLSFWGEADLDTRYETGCQSIWDNYYGNVPQNGRKRFSFNRIRRVINMVSGHQRRTRKSMVVTAVENGDEETADQFGKILMWACNQESILETISESFHGALVTGMNFLHVWMDYRQDPVCGNIKVDNCAYNAFLVDPYFRKHDLSDCNFIWKRSYLNKKECISLLPGHADEIMGMNGNEAGTARDGKFQFMPEVYGYGVKGLLAYDEFYYRDYRKQKLLVDTKTGETQEWKSEDKEALDAFLLTYPEIEVLESEVPTVKLAVVIQGKVFYDGPNPSGIDRYPFVPVLAYFNPQMPDFTQRIQGMVRNLRDPQMLYNHRRIIELDILESQVSSGFIYKENALVNPKDVFMSGQGRGIALKETANMADVQKIVAPSVPASMIQLSELLAKEVMEVSGVNEALLGSAQDDKAGVLEMLRQGAGLTTLMGLFDNLDRAQKLLGSIMLEMIQSNFTPGKVKKILQGAEPTAQFYSKAFGRYDVVVEDGLNTSTQKQMQFAQMLQMKELGVPISTADLLKAATIVGKKEIIENAIAQESAAADMQKKRNEIEMAEISARINLANARSVADEGLGVERYSRVEENKALAEERREEAHKDKEEGFLKYVQAIKELESLDLAHLEKLISLQQMLKQSQEVDNLKGDVKNKLMDQPNPYTQQESSPQPMQQEVAPQAQDFAGQMADDQMQAQTGMPVQ